LTKPGQTGARKPEHLHDRRAINVPLPGVVSGTSRLHQRQGFEACDLLGPENELIHVKRASGSEPLSHLFSQALVSVQTLANVPEARQKLAARIHELDPARPFPDDFMPEKVVFGILLKKGAELSVDTLFPFSQVTLAHIADEPQSQYHVNVEVIGITADSASTTV
jgi:uncharacterized protein (TIGR04141 family)